MQMPERSGIIGVHQNTGGCSEYRTDQEEQLDMTLNELFAIQEADVTKEFLLKAGWSEIAEEPAEIFRRSRLVPDRVESHKEYKS